MATKTITVSTAAQLTKALSTATGGETILLSSGNYGNLGIYGGAAAKYASAVTIQSADAGNPATFNSANIQGAKNITFDGVKFVTAFDGNGYPTSMSLRNDSNIIVKNSSFEGPLSTVNKTGSYDNNFFAGFATGTAFSVKTSDGITFDGNTIRQYGGGADLQYSSNVKFTNNEISEIRVDFVAAQGLKTADLSGNYMHTPITPPNENLHPDFMQFYGDASTTNSSNLTINNNIMVNNGKSGFGGSDVSSETNGAGVMQSILLQQKSADSKLDYQNVTISNNLIYGDNLHGVYVQNGNNLTITNNTVLSNNESDAGSAAVPGIQLEGARISNVVIDNNVTSLIMVPSHAKNVVSTDNFIVQRQDEAAPNYVGKLFVDTLGGFTVDYKQGDLLALANSVIVKNHIGSSLTWSNAILEKPALYIQTEAGAGLDKETFKYDAMTIFKSHIDLTGAKINLDFGDGSKVSTSFNGTHTYEPGQYHMSATITLANGQVISGTQTVIVHDPVLIDANFDKGMVDDSFKVNSLTTSAGNTHLVKTQLGQSLHLDTKSSYMMVGNTSDLHSNTQYSVSFAFKKDVATDSGAMLTWIRNAQISLGSDGKLLTTVQTQNGTSVQSKVAVALNDTNWHQITLTFDSKKGVATQYLDGKAIATLTGLFDIQTSASNVPVLGTAWGAQAMIGTYDNFKVLDGALTASEVAASYKALQDILHPVTAPSAAALEAAFLDSSVKAFLASNTVVVDKFKVYGEHAVSGAENTVLHVAAYNQVSTNAGNDLIYGNDQGNNIFAGGGKNIVIAGGGSDIVGGAQIVFGGGGDDTIRGTNENDVLYGDAGNDKLSGYGGSDKIYGGDGNDYIVGGKLGSYLDGGTGDDVVRGQSGDDTLYGGDGNDLLVGYEGKDFLDGGKGVDSIDAGAGNDKIVFDAADSAVMGGTGFDTLLIYANTPDFDLSSFTKFSGIDKIDMQNGTAEVFTLDYRDMVQADSHALFITGDGGDSVLFGSGVVLSLANQVAGTAVTDSVGHTFNHYVGASGNVQVDVYVDAAIHVASTT